MILSPQAKLLTNQKKYFISQQLAKYLTGTAQLKSFPSYSEFSPELRKQIDRAWNIMETTDLWLLPTMNPDGFARGREGKCSGDFYTDGRPNEERQVTILLNKYSVSNIY
jgi:hypothetical protein